MDSRSWVLCLTHLDTLIFIFFYFYWKRCHTYHKSIVSKLESFKWSMHITLHIRCISWSRISNLLVSIKADDSRSTSLLIYVHNTLSMCTLVNILWGCLSFYMIEGQKDFFCVTISIFKISVHHHWIVWESTWLWLSGGHSRCLVRLCGDKIKILYLPTYGLWMCLNLAKIIFFLNATVSVILLSFLMVASLFTICLKFFILLAIHAIILIIIDISFCNCQCHISLI